MFGRSKSKPKTGKKERERRSFAALFEQQRGPLLRFAYSRIKNEAEAEEIVQEAFIRFEQNYDVSAIASPEALLARIAANLVVDRLREHNARAAREEAWGNTYSTDSTPHSASGSVPDPARILSGKQQLTAVIECLDHMPAKTRQVFFLHRFEGLTHREIETRTGIPKSTIEKHMIRANHALARLRGKT